VNVTMKIISLLSFIILAAVNSGCKMERPTAVNANIPPPEMVLVEGGTFQMGSDGGDPGERPVHLVTLNSFYIDKYEVTYEKWVEVRTWALYHGYSYLPPGQNGCDIAGSSDYGHMQYWGMIQSLTEPQDWELDYHNRNAEERNRIRRILLGGDRDVISYRLVGKLPRTNGFNPQSKKNPVTMLDWTDIIQWCNARSEMEGLKPVYYYYGDHQKVIRNGYQLLNPDAADWEANGYRLPTDAEWEYAARGGVRTRNYEYSGSNKIEDVAWYKDNSEGATHSEGMKLANELGIYDMTGNVFEMVEKDDHGYSNTPQINPRPISLGSGGFRGGAFISEPHESRNTSREPSDLRDQWEGFRCVRGAVQ
jgi:formylglycine-generating enzyme required for sulfatase activity